MAKRSTGAQVIQDPRGPAEMWLVETVGKHAKAAGIGMPEVASIDRAVAVKIGKRRRSTVAPDISDTSLGRPVREDFTTIVDIRAEKQVTIGRAGVLHFYFDVFNLFNANTITARLGVLGPRYLQVDDVLAPRVIRIGGAWDF